MTIPLKGLFGIMLKSHPQLRIPTGKRKTSRLFTKRGKFAPRITEKKFLQQPSRGFEPESSASKSPFLTAEPSCLHHVAIKIFSYISVQQFLKRTKQQTFAQLCNTDGKMSLIDINHQTTTAA